MHPPFADRRERLQIDARTKPNAGPRYRKPGFRRRFTGIEEGGWEKRLIFPDFPQGRLGESA